MERERQQRRKTLSPSLLQLKAFWVENFHLDTEPEWEPSVSSGTVPVNGRAEIIPLEGDGEIEYIVRLNVSTKKVRSPLPYRLDVTVTGQFAFPVKFPEDERDRFIHLNGCAILYGIMRGVVASTSGMAPYGPIALPSVNFVSFFEQVATPRRSAARLAGAVSPD